MEALDHPSCKTWPVEVVDREGIGPYLLYFLFAVSPCVVINETPCMFLLSRIHAWFVSFVTFPLFYGTR